MEIQILYKTNTEKEVSIGIDIKFLIEKYDLKAFAFTNVLLIDEKADFPHSHPVLTINTRHLGKRNLLLSTYIHEQIHWFATQHFQSFKKAIQELKTIYPTIPVGYPYGARDEFSNYLHIIINWLELDVMAKVLEKSKYEEVLSFLQTDHYTWIYNVVISDNERIKEILDKYEIKLK
ncbi:hypothetical protein [Rossellomorea aquimaris]|uniref:Uncharacterized protein n=1 Tax=Rossellomorea aquimaris TaxID=189382 RepID=A0A5D4TAT0_9BACI|nr:hypothetical protein [Rossellomorea aquimaris]TYS71366.1 hypothetical protein FZC80_21960 [Rossellomorea aquimaris]